MIILSDEFKVVWRFVMKNYSKKQVKVTPLQLAWNNNKENTSSDDSDIFSVKRKRIYYYYRKYDDE